MAQGLLTRLTHERLGVLITDSPAYKFSNEFVAELSNPTKYTDLTRIQSVQYDFTHQAIDVKAIGSDKLVTRGGSSPIVRAPDVNCSMEYFFSEGQNEIAAGFYLGQDSSVLKKYFEFVEQDDYEAYVNQHVDLIAHYQKHAGLESYEITYFDALVNILADHSKPEKTIARTNDLTHPRVWIYIDSEWEEMNTWQYAYRGKSGDDTTVYPVNAQPKEVFGESHWFNFGEKVGYTMPKKKVPVFSDTNIIIVASSKDETIDLNRLNEESQFEDYNVIGIGNAFLTNYSYQAAIGQFPSVSLSYQASNMKYDAYSSTSKPKLPSIKRGINNLFSREDISLTRDMINDDYHGLEDENVVFDNHSAQASVIKPGDIKVIITKTQGGRGGAKIDGLEAAVQNLSIDVPITRQDIFGMGSNYVFDRKLKLPIIASMSIDMIVRGYEQDTVDSFLTQEDVYSFTIEHSIDEKTASKLIFQIDRAQLKSQNYTHSVNDHVVVSNSLSFDITKNDGLKMYFDKESVEFDASGEAPVSSGDEDESGEACCDGDHLSNKKPSIE